MKTRQLFPLGKAYGQAFCNRVEETRILTSNIEHGKHTLLIAPRRFGKSSLAERAINKSNHPFARMNFHLTTSEEEVTQLILDNVVKLIGKALGPIEKFMTSVKRYLSNLEPSLIFGDKLATLKLIPKRDINHSVIIAEALLLLERLLKEKNKFAVIFFDEFQELDHITKHHALEGAIRTAAQETQHLSIIFSGSVRSLLLSMFEDEKRPLYKLCRKIKLTRIHETDYEKHIQKIAARTWKKSLSEDAFEQIMRCSNRHPYYVNYLCDTLWQLNEKLPNQKAVLQAWNQVVMEEWSDALRELSDLPMSQRRVLKFIAQKPIKNLHSQAVSTALSMAVSSIASAIKALAEKDYIEQDDDENYIVINPLLLAVLLGAEG